MSLETEVANFSSQAAALLSTINGQKDVLIQRVADATAQADRAAAQADQVNTGVGDAAGSAAQALAIYGSAAEMNDALTTAAAQASAAQSAAASAASVLQQDLSAVSAALHRSPNTITAMCIYDTSKDSDGGAWVERMQHTSWANEPLNGAWRGALASEAAARAISGAATGDYYQLTADGKFYKLNAGAGVTEVFRGNTAKLSRLPLPIAEANTVTLYSATEPGRPMWGRWAFAAATFGTITSVAALNAKILIGTTLGLITLDFAKDEGRFQQAAADRTFRLTDRASGSQVLIARPAQAFIVNNAVNAVAMTVLPDAPVDLATGLQVPTIAVFTAGGISLIRDNGTVVNSASTTSFIGGSVDKDVLTAYAAGSTFYYALKPFSLSAGFVLSTMSALAGTGVISKFSRLDRSQFARSTSGAALVSRFRLNETVPAKGSVTVISDTYSTGHMLGDIRRAYLCNTEVESVSNPATVADRSYKGAAATVYGTLVKSQVASAAQLCAWSGFSATNYVQEPYSADLDYGTGEFSFGSWFGTTTAALSTLIDRSAATGPYYRLGMDAAGKLVATAFDGTTTRTVTTTAAYNTGVFTKVRATYLPTGKLGITVNGVEVASATGAPLLTMSNANAVLTIGNSRDLDAPFPGSITLLKTGATVPTTEQAQWMYGQEKMMFRDGAQITLPAASAVTDLSYDESQDRWVALQAGYESSFTGLIRTSAAVPSAGSFSKVDAKGGVKLLSRTTTSPGVDVTIPAYGLREQLVRRAEAAARASKTLTVFDFDAIAAQTDFQLPVGWTATEVLSTGASQREGATKAWARLFDGFRETVRFAVAPGAAAWVQITARKE